MPAIRADEASGEILVTWNFVADSRQLFAYHFMDHAFLAGTIVAVSAGCVGYFMVVRGQSFAGHTLANVGFAGATGAALVGAPPVAGLLLFGVLSAIGIAALDEQRATTSWGRDVATGTVLTFSLGLGLLFVHVYNSYAAGVYAILFGAVLGIADRDVAVLAVTAAATLACLVWIGRPLLFASVDPVVAESRGVPVRLLGYVFLLVMALAVALAVQVVGTLLIFSLLVTPAATARRLTAEPGFAVAVAVALSVLFTWCGLTVAYFSSLPVGFAITTLAFSTYGLVRVARAASDAIAPRRGAVTEGPAA